VIVDLHTTEHAVGAAGVAATEAQAGECLRTLGEGHYLDASAPRCEGFATFSILCCLACIVQRLAMVWWICGGIG
jgi:hypothetical protein